MDLTPVFLGGDLVGNRAPVSGTVPCIPDLATNLEGRGSSSVLRSLQHPPRLHRRADSSPFSCLVRCRRQDHFCAAVSMTTSSFGISPFQHSLCASLSTTGHKRSRCPFLRSTRFPVPLLGRRHTTRRCCVRALSRCQQMIHGSVCAATQDHTQLLAVA
ncbi:unnamed protein product [Chondrus crispus]|uniref:Uncharacterized protein n=1 Tax=Chondrus crispus TaxID=2769 RepID=R7Q7U0_CHOCR|nr:unnamed protein product [Chondrus crispus]CDF34094.1 unnamed protein product [Chondrus crispus]|eukprot:XP_005713913.1 unnamed protein product [Chondrus crispus]